ncbi:hypothetical protein LTS18_012071, partial [Coniosporium uncinatum]
MTSIGNGTRDEARSMEDSPSTRSFKRMKLSSTDRDVPVETLTIVGRDVQKIEIFYDLFGIIQRSFPGRFRHMKNNLPITAPQAIVLHRRGCPNLLQRLEQRIKILHDQMRWRSCQDPGGMIWYVNNFFKLLQQPRMRTTLSLNLLARLSANCPVKCKLMLDDMMLGLALELWYTSKGPWNVHSTIDLIRGIRNKSYTHAVVDLSNSRALQFLTETQSVANIQANLDRAAGHKLPPELTERILKFTLDVHDLPQPNQFMSIWVPWPSPLKCPHPTRNLCHKFCPHGTRTKWEARSR